MDKLDVAIAKLLNANAVLYLARKEAELAYDDYLHEVNGQPLIQHPKTYPLLSKSASVLLIIRSNPSTRKEIRTQLLEWGTSVTTNHLNALLYTMKKDGAIKHNPVTRRYFCTAP